MRKIPFILAALVGLTPAALTTTAAAVNALAKEKLPDMETRQKTMAAARGGDTFAQFAVAKIYDLADRPALAAPWYERAARGGIAEAQARLGLMFYEGRGTNIDYLSAVKWLQRAAKQGDSGAFYNLSFCYYHGRGVQKDLTEAYKWMRLAEAANNLTAARQLNFMSPELSDFQREEASRRAREFVSVKEKIRHETNSGTGFFITADGYLITCAHVIEGKKRLSIKLGAKSLQAKLIYSNPKLDLALLKAKGTFESLPVNFIKQAKLGEPILTLGFPNVWLLGADPKLATGEITGLSGMQNDSLRYQINAVLQHGNSGGALIDKYGQVIGVVDSNVAENFFGTVADEQPRNIAYAIKSSIVGRFLSRVPSLAAKLKQPGPRLELGAETLTEQARKATVMVVARTK